MSFNLLLRTIKAFHLRFRAYRRTTRDRLRKPSIAIRPETLEPRTALSSGYTFSTLNDPAAGKVGSYPGIQGTYLMAINDRGEILGSYGDAGDLTHGLLLNGGKYATLNDPKAGAVANSKTDVFPGTYPAEINDAGKIVGSYIDSNNIQHSFLLSAGRYTTIDPPGAANRPGPMFTGNIDQASSINDLGQIVGGYSDAQGVTQGYLLSGGRYTTLNDPNGVFTFATGINDHGQIVGFYIDKNGIQHGFERIGGKYTTLNDPSARTGNAQGTLPFMINNSGEIIGWFVDADNDVHGFGLSKGQYTTIDDPSGVGSTFAGGINDRGDVTGYYFDSNGLAHGFLATPTKAK